MHCQGHRLSDMKKITEYLKKEAVFIISVVLAAVSCFFVHPDSQYLSYIDIRTILLLFSLMLVVQAFVDAGLFQWAQNMILKKTRNPRLLGLLLVLLVFISSMAVTNDVALISFVPFTLLMFSSFDRRDSAFIVVMETIAANLGSMATPFGNPQNLFLYSSFAISNSDFFRTVLPSSAVSLIMLACLCWFHRYRLELPAIQNEEEKSRKLGRSIWIYVVLFVMILLSVLRLIPVPYAAAFAALVILVFNRKVFLKVDYALLLTFCAFFIFVGNMKRIPQISSMLETSLSGNEYWWGLGLSQLISNVPAAIMLSGFASDIRMLLLGVNIGGLGTLIASLASLISFKGYSGIRKSEGAYYFAIFTFYNLLFLAALIPFSYFFRF